MERKVLTKRMREKVRRREREVVWTREVTQRKKMIAIRKIVKRRRRNPKRKVRFLKTLKYEYFLKLLFICN